MLHEVDASVEFSEDIDFVKQKLLAKLLSVRNRNEEFIEKTLPKHVPPVEANGAPS